MIYILNIRLNFVQDWSYTGYGGFLERFHAAGGLLRRLLNSVETEIGFENAS